MLAYTPVDFYYVENLAKASIFLARQNKCIHEKCFNKNPVRHVPVALNKNLQFAGSFMTMKTTNFQDDVSSIPTDNFKDHFSIVFDLTSMPDATEFCHYHELV